ncbi:hypothetical protein OHS81_21980 [Streptomyces sp. NBC_00400]|uniref:hypothetical protein n=1 Tax=Streptomyces sp. NBC_00400 TaxID=2975737 RepID=UPI002E22F90F
MVIAIVFVPDALGCAYERLSTVQEIELSSVLVTGLRQKLQSIDIIRFVDFKCIKAGL